LRWLFFLTSAISSPATELAFNRVAVKFSGGSPDEAAIARGEKTLPDPLRVVENHLANQKWMLGEFSLVDCDYGPTFNYWTRRAQLWRFPPRARVPRSDSFAPRLAGDPEAARALNATECSTEICQRCGDNGKDLLLARFRTQPRLSTQADLDPI
jgi:glutathione S-transferase